MYIETKTTQHLFYKILLLALIISLILPTLGDVLNKSQEKTLLQDTLEPLQNFTGNTRADPQELTFFLHNVSPTDPSKNIPGGGSTQTYFDTTMDFNDVETTLTATGTNNWFDWYLCPAVAKSVSVNSITLKIWGKAGSGPNQNANIDVYIYDRVGTGAETERAHKNFGAQIFRATPELFLLEVPFSSTYAFQTGSSIRVRLAVSASNDKTVYFFYNSRASDSRVVIPTEDYLGIQSISTLDYSETPKSTFPLMEDDKTIHFRTVMEDPFGTYDVRWVNITVYDPDDSIIIDNKTMAKISGLPYELSAVYNYSWNYSGYLSGKYSIKIWAVDNSGQSYYSHFAMFTFGDHPVLKDSFFYIGGMPKYLWVKAMDNMSNVLSGALVYAKISDNTEGMNTTNISGMTNLTIYPGIYDLEVFWQGIQVAKESYNLLDNISDSDPLIINCSVYYPTILVTDNRSVPISSAAVFITHPNGTKMDAMLTNATGEISLLQFSGGDYYLLVQWRGKTISASVIEIGSNNTYKLVCSVYYLNITAVDHYGKPVENVGISAFDNITQLIMDFSMTNTTGEAQIRVPGGFLDVILYWRNIPVNTTHNYEVDTDESLEMICSIFVVPITVTDTKGNFVDNARVVVRKDVDGEVMDEGISNSTGELSLALIGGSYHVDVFWKEIRVKSSEMFFDGNEIVIATDVYYVSFRANDSLEMPVANARIMVMYNDELFAYNITDDLGLTELRLPSAEFDIKVLWNNIEVFRQTQQISSAETLDLDLRVNYVTYSVRDSHNESLQNAMVQIFVAESDYLLGSNYTDLEGYCTIRLPQTKTDVRIIWNGVEIYVEEGVQIYGDASINMSTWTYYVTFAAKDSLGMPVVEASINVLSNIDGSIISSDQTPWSGNLTFRLPMGNYSINVFWKNILVKNIPALQVSDDIPDLVLNLDVFYIELLARDSAQSPLNLASVDITSSSTNELLASGRTFSDGKVTLRIPSTIVNIKVFWDEVNVYLEENYSIIQNELKVLDAKVYYLEISTNDSLDMPVKDARIVLYRHGDLKHSGISNTQGTCIFRLPMADYDIEVYWKNILVNSTAMITVDSDIILSMSLNVFHVTFQVLDSKTIPVHNAQVSVYEESTMELYEAGLTDMGGNIVLILPSTQITIRCRWNSVLICNETGYNVTDNSIKILEASVYYINLVAQDAKGLPLYNAILSSKLKDTGLLIDRGSTNKSGVIELRLPLAEIEIIVNWNNYEVHSSHLFVKEDIGSVEAIVLDCKVYHVVFKAVDSKEIILMNAQVSILSNELGLNMENRITDENGFTRLRIPGGEYQISVIWNDYPVFSDDMTISSNIDEVDPAILSCQVYYVKYLAMDSREEPISNATISLSSNDLGITMSSVQTDENGMSTVRLPRGDHDIMVVWKGVKVFEENNIHYNSDLDEDKLNCSVYYYGVHSKDSRDVSVENAVVKLINRNVPGLSVTEITDSNGFTEFRLPADDYIITAYWRDILVAGPTALSLTDDANPDLECSIEYLEISCVDVKSIPLENAQVSIYLKENSVQYFNLVTDSTGIVEARLPGSDYRLLISWHDVLVFQDDSLSLDGMKSIQPDCEVYYLTVKAKGSAVDKIKDVSVTVLGTDNPNSYSNGTGADGMCIFRIPAGNYRVSARLQKTEMYKKIDKTQEEDIFISSSMETEFSFPDYPPSFFSTPSFYSVTLPITLFFLIILALLFLGFTRMKKERETQDEDPDDIEAEEETASDTFEEPDMEASSIDDLDEIEMETDLELMDEEIVAGEEIIDDGSDEDEGIQEMEDEGETQEGGDDGIPDDEEAEDLFGSIDDVEVETIEETDGLIDPDQDEEDIIEDEIDEAADIDTEEGLFGDSDNMAEDTLETDDLDELFMDDLSDLDL